MLEEQPEIRKEVQHGAWAGHVCRQGRTTVGQDLEQKYTIMWGRKR